MANPTHEESNGNEGEQCSSKDNDGDVTMQLHLCTDNEGADAASPPNAVENTNKKDNVSQDCQEVSNFVNDSKEAPNGIDDFQETSDDIQHNQEETDGLLDSSVMETSVAESEEVEQSPVKGAISCSDSESDASSDSKVPAKKRKKGSGNYEGLRHHHELKRTRNPFIQKKECEKLKQALGKCLECKWKVPKHGRKGKDSVCRFLSFRKLRYSGRGTLTVAGFPDSEDPNDYSKEDMSLWTPQNPPEGMDIKWAKFLLLTVGDQFCELVKQEKEALIELNKQENKKITFRRVVQNLREMCDVCSTTLFNYHWTCGKCGFVVCVSCFKARRGNNVLQIPSSSSKESKDDFGWLRCHSKGEHSLERLMLTQIVAGKALDNLWKQLHELRRQLEIPEDCECESSETLKVPISDATVDAKSAMEQARGGTASEEYMDDLEDAGEGAELLDLISGAISKENRVESKKNDASNASDEEADDQGGILDLFGSDPTNESQDDKENGASFDPSISVENVSNSSLQDSKTADVAETRNFKRKGRSSAYSIKVAPKKVLAVVQTKRMFPNIPHSFLCHGYLLRLLEPSNPGNIQIFQHQWKRGQPVIVSNVGSVLNKDLWSPESFSRDFGHKTSHFINCMTGKVVPHQKMKKFWDGFEHVKQRLQDDNGKPMLLKLKDWPPSDDFAKLLPERFKDLMNVLPLGEYTHRDGKLNLAARLPDIFCKPDLGPKMYIAYGSGLHLDKGTTNLHLDVSDAVNVMVHVGVVKDDDTTEHDEAVMKAIEDSDCDSATTSRVTKNKELPGALWHIWEARDADKIRDMMNKCAYERKLKVERHHDPIHDQSWYLDSNLRKRLREEYNVVGYPILQCEGDAVFIPAGAPHQVRNLNNCIKIAEDFVSPENVGHCFYLTEEFRNLTETHTNHEDKLQIKNIVYHTVKDAVAVIHKHLGLGQE